MKPSQTSCTTVDGNQKFRRKNSPVDCSRYPHDLQGLIYNPRWLVRDVFNHHYYRANSSNHHTFALFDSWEIDNLMTPVVVPQFFHQEDVATQPLNSGPS